LVPPSQTAPPALSDFWNAFKACRNTQNRTPLEGAELPAKLARLEDCRKALVTALATATALTHLHTLCDNNFLFLAKLSQAKKTKGVRATLYRLASTGLGYYDVENDAFWYEGDDLKICVLFRSERDADYFHRRLNDESLYHNASNPHEEDDVENSRLALSSDVHHWFDGRNVAVHCSIFPFQQLI
jgi:hypothetical protein